MNDAEPTRREFPEIREIIYYQSRSDLDDIVLFEDGVYRHQNDGPQGEPIADFDQANHTEVSRLRRHNTEFGNYAWDHWQQWAIDDGIPEDLAGLGRSLIREADQHGWDTELQAKCGWTDSGAAMIEFALQHPEQARRGWEHLLVTDGNRVPPPASNGN